MFKLFADLSKPVLVTIGAAAGAAVTAAGSCLIFRQVRKQDQEKNRKMVETAQVVAFKDGVQFGTLMVASSVLETMPTQPQSVVYEAHQPQPNTKN